MTRSLAGAQLRTVVPAFAGNLVRLLEIRRMGADLS